MLKDQEDILFYVRDTGIGLPENKQEVIFERFRQVEESSTKGYGGTGLGLTISKKLVELLGGKIRVESTPGKGSIFYFTLPFIRPDTGLDIMVPDKAIEKAEWGEKQMLIVEDEVSNFELVRAILAKTKIRLLWAKNGREAVDICRKDPGIDLVLMDIRMPEMDGYTAARKIREFNQEIPIISLTAHAMAEDREKSIKAGCNDYIPKPLMPDDLMKKIGKFLND